MHSLIIGGGLAGPLTALALTRAGISCAVYEAFPEGAALGVGAWLTVAVNGLHAMQTLGVSQQAMALGFPSREITLRSGTGKQLGVVPIGGELDYLDDGTMVVVEGGGKLIGKKVKINVTSVIQTNAGKMVFTKLAQK